MRVLVLDNYDSFTWNLVHGLETAGGRCVVHRSDQISLAAIEEIRPQAIVLSPGPFGPDQAGICAETVRVWSGRVPLLGVCLGMQVIASFAGSRVVQSGAPVHGRALPVHHDGLGLFKNVPDPFQAARYHSLILDPASIPARLTVSASSPDGTIMGIRLDNERTDGLLFHPESFMTEHSAQIFSNFLSA